MSTKRPSVKNQQQRVDQWNAQYPEGTDVAVTRDCGEVIETKTRSQAELLGGHTAVIWLDGIRGCYLLERVAPRSP